MSFLFKDDLDFLNFILHVNARLVCVRCANYCTPKSLRMEHKACVRRSHALDFHIPKPCEMFKKFLSMAQLFYKRVLNLFVYFNRWYRAKIVGVDELKAMYDLFFVDHGDREWVGKSKVVPAWPDILSVKKLFGALISL